MKRNPSGHIRLTSHPSGGKPHRFPIDWGASTAQTRGPVIGSTTARHHRNVIGAHGGAYSIYRAFEGSACALVPEATSGLKGNRALSVSGLHMPLVGSDTVSLVVSLALRLRE